MVKFFLEPRRRSFSVALQIGEVSNGDIDMTRLQLLAHVKTMIQAKGGIHAASRSWDIQEGNLRAVMEGRAQPGPRLAKALDITQKADGEWVVTRIFGS